MTMVAERERTPSRELLNKVPEVTLWFWIIKILCTTVGESFADWVNETLGFGLLKTTVLFTVVLVGVLAWQLRLPRYVPFAYWLTVVALSVTGTLYTDILTDHLKVPLWISTTAFAALLAVVFGIWWSRERTLSIHSIVTLPREAFYWLAILVTFALGTAAGDWTLDLTGWAPGTSVLLPLALIAAIVVGWRLGANAVLAFWLAYVLTRPLGANLGDWLALPHDQHGLGLGTAGTSIVFLLGILGTVVFLTVSKVDSAAKAGAADDAAVATNPQREKAMLGYLAAVIAIAAAVLVHAHGQPHGAAAAAEEADSPTPATTPATLAGGAPAPTTIPAPHQLTHAYPATDVAGFRQIVADLQAKVQAGDQKGALTRVKDLETAWDVDQPKLQAADATSWHVLDSQIDAVLTSIRAKHPDPAIEGPALATLATSLA